LVKRFYACYEADFLYNKRFARSGLEVSLGLAKMKGDFHDSDNILTTSTADG